LHYCFFMQKFLGIIVPSILKFKILDISMNDLLDLVLTMAITSLRKNDINQFYIIYQGIFF
jgi:hypothetical protein